jgi:hypothetical protein
MSDRTSGDTAPPLTGNVSANLNGADIEVHIQRPDGTVISRAGVPGAGTDGAWSLDLIDGDLTTGGRYLVEIEATFDDESVQTCAEDVNGLPAYFNVRDQLE